MKLDRRLIASILLLGLVGWALQPHLSPAQQTPTVDWPSFRGRQAIGVSQGSLLPTKWNANQAAGPTENVLWQVEVPGLGHSSPVVVGDQLFVATAIASGDPAELKVESGGAPSAADDNGEQRWVVLCYHKKTGKELWRRMVKQGKPRTTRHVKATHANTSLAIDGDNLIAFFGSEGLYCFDLQGNPRWSKDLGRIDISKYGIGWGYASSPAVAHDRIVVVCDDPEQPYIASLDLRDGSEIWRVSRAGICQRSWSTPLIHRDANGTQVVVNGWPWVMSYDLETGRERWRLKSGGDNPVPTPFVANGWFYITNAHGGPSPIFVVRPSASGDISLNEDAKQNGSIVWAQSKGGSYLSTPVVFEKHLYLGNTNGVVRCFQASTGQPVYSERLGSKAGIVASLVAGDGKVYCASENGTVYVLQGGDKFKVLARNQMGEPCLATPAISEGVLYIRTTRRLVAIAE